MPPREQGLVNPKNMNVKRSELKKRLREEAATNIVNSAPLVTHVAKAMKTSVANLKPNETLDERYHWDQPGGKIVIGERRDGTGYPRYVHEEYQRRNRVTTCEPMLVVDSCFGEDGNLGVPRTKTNANGEEKTYTENNPKKAKYELTLSVGCPDSLSDAYKSKLKESQPKFVASVKTLVNGMWKEGIDAGIYDDALGEQSKEVWLKNQYSCFMNSNDHIELKRAIQGFRGEPQPMRYWKKTKAGTHEQFQPTEIPKGSLVVAQYYPKPYCFQDKDGVWKHGSTADLGRDLVVVWMPKTRTKEEMEQEKNKKLHDALADVPFFEF